VCVCERERERSSFWEQDYNGPYHCFDMRLQESASAAFSGVTCGNGFRNDAY
jgi:hypothetical protein